MGRFTKIDKVDNTYIPVNLDYSRPKILMNQQLNKELDLTMKAIEQDASTKLKYSELLGKIRPQDYAKAQGLLDNYLDQRSQAIANSKDSLSLAAAQSSGASLLSNPAFSKLINDKNQIDSELAIEQKLREQGKSANIINPQVLNESRYDKLGNENPDFSASKIKVTETLDYDKDIQELVKKEAKADIRSSASIDPNTGLIREVSIETLGENKLASIADKTFPTWRNSGYGRSMYEELTQPTQNNQGKTYPKEVAEAIMKERFTNIAKGLAYSEVKNDLKNSPFATAASKAEPAITQTQVPAYPEQATQISQRFAGILGNDRALDGGLRSSNAPNVPVTINLAGTYKVGDSQLLGEVGSKTKESKSVTGTLTGYVTKPVIKSVEVDGKYDNSQTEALQDHMVYKGKDGNIKIDPNEKSLTDEYGRSYYMNGKYKFYIEDRAFKEVVDKDGNVHYAPTNIGESVAFVGKNYTDNTYTSFTPEKSEKSTGQSNVYLAKLNKDPDFDNTQSLVFQQINQGGILTIEEATAYQNTKKDNYGRYILDTPAKNRAFRKINSAQEEVRANLIKTRDFKKNKDMTNYQSNFQKEQLGTPAIIEE